MKFKKPVNENYCGTIVEIKNVIPLPKCDRIQHTFIFGNPIIVSKDTKVGDIGVYFPAETQLSEEFTSYNNLFRHSEKNADPDQKGYLEDNRRIRTMKMRNNKSCGLFMPIESLAFLLDKSEFEVGDIFDEIKGIPICNKYVVRKKTPGEGNKKKNKVPKVSKIVEKQFRFHEDTAHFGKNAYKFSFNDIVSITYKLHGTSAIFSKILCKRNLGIFSKILKFLGFDIVNTEYSNIWASRKVVKNDDINKEKNHFYKTDIWRAANEKIKEFLLDGMSIYAEIVGFIPETGGAIQKALGMAFDYGCEPNEFEVYIYRITYTNPSGDVFEFSDKQVQDWCKERGLKAVPELFYGRIGDIFEWEDDAYSRHYDETLSFEDNLINYLREKYLEKDCFMCENELPAEGIVIRKETNNFEAYKFKSFRFLEMESKQLDTGEEDIEESQCEENV